MKLNVMCAGCEITVEEVDGKCVVMAMKDGELVEEFAVDCEEMEEEAEEAEEEMEEAEEAEEEAEEEALEESKEEETQEDVNESVKNFGDFMKSSK